MDLSLLRALRSMKRVESDPSNPFRAETLDLDSLTPAHPNVVVVDQTSSKSFASTDSGETRRRGRVGFQFVANSLTEAVTNVKNLALRRSNVTNEGWTIVLKEGLYVDPSPLFIAKRGQLPGSPRVEIVGLKEVRILFDRNDDACFNVEGADIRLRNIRIYDYRKNPLGGPTVFATLATRAVLDNVQISAPVATAAYVNKKSSVTLNDCSLIKCRVGFTSKDDGLMRLENCFASQMDYRIGGVGKGSKLIVGKTRFVIGARGGICVWSDSRCFVEDSRFENDKASLTDESSSDDYLAAFEVRKASHLSCRGTSFGYFDVAVNAVNSATQVVLRDCHFAKCGVPSILMLNASGSLEKCSIDARHILGVKLNVDGRITLEGNRLSPSTLPRIGIDPGSTRPKHDLEDDVVYTPIVGEPSDLDSKRRSEFTKSLREAPKEVRFEFLNGWQYTGEYKFCRHCFKLENLEALVLAGRWKPLEKFKYCPDCQEVCYCSKACQAADWNDHRLECSKRTAAKSGKASKPKSSKRRS